VALNSVQNISQSFIAKGNILNSISVYFGEVSDQILNIAVLDQNGKIIISEDINLNDYGAEEWNKIGLNSGGFKRNEQYEIIFSSEKELSVLRLVIEEAPASREDYWGKSCNWLSIYIYLSNTWECVRIFNKIIFSVGYDSSVILFNLEF